MILYFYPPKEMPKGELHLDGLTDDGAEEELRAVTEATLESEDVQHSEESHESEQEEESEEGQSSGEEDEDEAESPSSRTQNAFALLEEECP